MTNKYKIGVRTADGLSHVFSVEHESVNTIEQVTLLTNNEIAEAKVILVLVPNNQ